MIALDYPEAGQAWSLVRQLEQSRPYVKVGMQLFYAVGPGFIRQLKETGLRIFIDLKLHDIPTTVKGAAQSLTKLGVDMLNVHCAGGKRMMEAAVEGVEKALVAGQSRPAVIGVTHLTSTSQDMLNEQIGIAGKLEDAIAHYARLAQQSGLDGVVCSPLEVPLIKQICGASFLTVTPGIRTRHGTVDDQVRITTPLQAQQLGTDYMVIGRAVTNAEEPLQAYEQIIQELSD